MRISKVWRARYLVSVGVHRHYSRRDLDAAVLASQPVVLSASVQFRRLDPAEHAKWVRQARADRVINRVRELGATDDAYAWVAYVAATGGVEVARVGGAQRPEIAARYTALGTSKVPVTIRDALLSEKQVKVLQDAIVRDRDILAAEGIDLFTIGVQDESGALNIAVLGGRTSRRSRTDLTPAIEETLLQRYGDAYYGRDKLAIVRGGRMDLRERVVWGADWPGTAASPIGQVAGARVSAERMQMKTVGEPRINKVWKTRYRSPGGKVWREFELGVHADPIYPGSGFEGQPVLITAGVWVRRVDPAEEARMLKQERAMPVLERAREVGEATDAAYFSVGYDQATGGVFVWRVGGGKSRQADARYTALATSEVPVTVLDALVSWKEAKSVMDAVARDMQALRAEGIMFNYAGVESEGVLEGVRPGRVEIGVRDLTPEQAETLLQRYADPTIGRDKVVVVERADMVPLSGGR